MSSSDKVSQALRLLAGALRDEGIKIRSCQDSELFYSLQYMRGDEVVASTSRDDGLRFHGDPAVDFWSKTRTAVRRQTTLIRAHCELYYNS